MATRHINVLHYSTRAGGLLLKERAHDYNGGTASPRHEGRGKADQACRVNPHLHDRPVNRLENLF
jgi:hypothetical protein